jgi:hypothetical protein
MKFIQLGRYFANPDQVLYIAPGLGDNCIVFFFSVGSPLQIPMTAC